MKLKSIETFYNLCLIIIGISAINLSMNFYYLKDLLINKSRQFNQLQTVDQILKTPQKFIEKENQMRQNNDDTDDYENISIAVFNKKAYWVKNNNVYSALISEDGDVDITTAKKIDVFSLDQNELANLLKIIDKINQ